MVTMVASFHCCGNFPVVQARWINWCSRWIRWWLHTHTHTHPFNGPFSRTTQVRRYQKGKTNLDFTEARDSEWQWHQLGHMQVCNSLQTDNHASTPPLSFFYSWGMIGSWGIRSTKVGSVGLTQLSSSLLFTEVHTMQPFAHHVE